MNRSLQENLRVTINGNNKKNTERSTDVKLFPLAYNYQITKTFGLSPYELAFDQKRRKPLTFRANASKNSQGYCQPKQDLICYNLAVITKIIFTIHIS